MEAIKNDALVAQHGVLLGLGESAVTPAPYGRNWLAIICVASIALVAIGGTVGWVAQKVEIARIAAEEAEKEERARVEKQKYEEAKTALEFAKLYSQFENTTAGHWAKLLASVKALEVKGADDERVARMLAAHPSPVDFTVRPWAYDKEKARAEYAATGAAPSLDAEETRVNVILNQGIEWANAARQIADSLRWTREIPTWFTAKYGVAPPAEIQPVEPIEVQPAAAAPVAPEPVVSAPAPSPAPAAAPPAPPVPPKPAYTPPRPAPVQGKVRVDNW